MGRSIDLYSYDYGKTVNKIMDVCKTEDKETIEKVLLCCGNKIGDRYVILNQEMWEGYSCYYNVATTLERIFETDDVFGEVFCTYKDNGTDRQELISAMDLYEIKQELNIDFDEEY